MSEDEQAIRTLVTSWLTASKAGDTEKVLSLMGDDAVFLVPGKPPMRGKAEFAKSQSEIRDFHMEAESEIKEIRIFGDWAFLWSRLSVVMTPPGGQAPVRRAGHTLSILQKQGDAWLIVRDANMLAADDGDQGVGA